MDPCMKRVLYLFASGLFAMQVHAQGGETCASATTISSLPYSNTSSTTTSVDNYFAACPDGDEADGRDRVYQYTTGASVEYVDISLCEAITNFDSKLFVYEGACTGTPYACRDDGCQSPAFNNPYNSILTNLALGPDTTYYIVVDGFNGNSAGNYRLNVRVGAGPLIFWSGFEADESLASAVDESQLAACSSPATRIRSRK